MSTVTITGIVHKDRYSEGYAIFPFDMSSGGYVVVGPIETQYRIPEGFNLVAAQVAALDKQLDAVRDEYSQKIKAIEDAKSKLLCIENGVAA